VPHHSNIPVEEGTTTSTTSCWRLLFAARLVLQVPWSKLGTEPVVAEFDRLYIVASPREDDSGKGSCAQNVDDAIAAAHAAEQAAKRQRIDTAEDTWLKVRGRGTVVPVWPGDLSAQHSCQHLFPPALVVLLCPGEGTVTTIKA
jgi:hypothetical protein